MGKNDIKKSFGAAVRHRRGRLGISQEELAGRAGLHRTYISDVERGARNVSLESIHRLASALDIPMSLLFAWQNGGSGHDRQAGGHPLLPDELVDILIVEDSEEDAELTIKALRNVRMTNRIYVVRDGQAALNFLFCKGEYEHRRQNDRPQLILLDLRLPKIDGIEVLRQVKANPHTRSIPVIVLTVVSRDRDVLASQKLGADAYIVKPVDFHNLSGVTPQLSMHWALLKRSPVANA